MSIKWKRIIRMSTRGNAELNAVAKVKLVFYALLMCTINFSAVYYAFFYDGGSGLFADKGQYTFGEQAKSSENEVPVTMKITSRHQEPIGNREVILKSMLNGKASFPQKMNEKGIVQWRVSQGFYTVEIYLNQQIIKEKVVILANKKHTTIQLNLDI